MLVVFFFNIAFRRDRAYALGPLSVVINAQRTVRVVFLVFDEPILVQLLRKNAVINGSVRLVVLDIV